MTPLPRTCQRVDGSAYLNHVELTRRTPDAGLPARLSAQLLAQLHDTLRDDPLMHQGGSDDLLGPHDDIPLAHEEWGIDFGAGIAVIVDDVPMGVRPDEAHGRIRLLMLANDVSLCNLIPAELAKGTGFLQSKPATGFSPVAVTPAELGNAWRCGQLGTVTLSTSRTRASTWLSISRN